MGNVNRKMILRKGTNDKSGKDKFCEDSSHRLSRLSLEDPIPELEDIKVVKRLGKGSFGVVEWVSIHGESYALKKMNKARFFRSSNHSSLAWNERNTMMSCESPFVLPLECCFQTDEELYLLTPLYHGGDLLGRLKELHSAKSSSSPESTLSLSMTVEFYMAEIILALEELHSKQICHRDVKPENIFIDKDGHVVLGDMGLAITINEDDDDDDSRFWGKCGSYGYRSPECVRSQVCGYAADMYSLGMTGYFLAFGGVPWSETKRRLDKENLTGKDSLFFPANTEITEDLQNLLREMLEVEQDDRITLEEAKTHKALSWIDWDQLALKKGHTVPWIPPALPPEKEINKMIQMHAKVAADESATKRKYLPLTKKQQLSFVGFDNYEYALSKSHALSKTLATSDSFEITPTPSPHASPQVSPLTSLRRLGVARSPSPNLQTRTLKKSDLDASFSKLDMLRTREMQSMATSKKKMRTSVSDTLQVPPKEYFSRIERSQSALLEKSLPQFPSAANTQIETTASYVGKADDKNDENDKRQ
jgi:serine/threonine protein kinase